MSITSIVEDSGSSPSGEVGEDVDYSMLHFTATYDDESTSSVIPNSVTPPDFGEAGTIPVTFGFAGTDVTCIVNYDVEEPAEPVLDSLEITGSLTNTQYLTDAPDLTGLTIKAVYDNGDKVTLSLTDPNLDVSPATYTYTTGDVPTSTDLTISYTDGEVTATSGVQNVEVHGKTEYTLPIGESNVVYYDGLLIPNQDSCPGIGDLAGGAEVSIGDYVHLIFTEDAWDNGTTIGISDIMALVPSYGVDMSNFGAFGEGDGNNYKVDYYKMGLTGEGTAETGVSIVVALAPLTRVIDVQTGYSKADLDMTDSLARVYKLNVAVS